MYVQLGQLIMYYTPKKVLPIAYFNLTYQAFKSREGIAFQTNLSDLKLDTYEGKQKKI